MYLPRLYSSSNHVAGILAKYILNKYGYLLKFKKSEVILEIGTGDGRTTIEALLPRLPTDLKEFVASDKSINMIHYGKTVEALRKMTFIELDVEAKRLPQYLEDKFDHIFSLFVFHFVKNSRQGLQNIYRMLKPGGEVFGIFFSETVVDEAWYSLSKNPKWMKYDPNAWVSPYYQNPEVLKIFQQHLNNSGFKNCFLQLDDYHYDFKSHQEFKDLMTAVNLSVKKIPKEYLAEYLEEYFALAKNSKLLPVKKTKNGEELPPTGIMKMVTFYGQKL